MELTQIKYFLEAAKNQHITNSAKKLHIAQPALTKSIHKLENELGVKLFEQKGRNIILTPSGKYLSEQYEAILSKLENVNEKAKEIDDENQRTVHINVLAASTLLTQAIIKYQNTHNATALFKLQQNTQDEPADIEISSRSYTHNENNKITPYQFVSEESIYLAVPDNEKYRGIKSIALEEVSQERFISLIGSKQFRYICDKFCHQAGFLPKNIFESDNTEAVKNMIAGNLGVGFWPEYSWGKIESNAIKLLKIENPICKREILVTLNPKSNNTCVSDFFDFFRDFCIQTKQNCNKIVNKK